MVMDTDNEAYSVIYAGRELRVVEAENGWQIEIDPAPRSGDRTMTFVKLSEALDEAMQIVDRAAS
jgi:hypothetical protein